MSPWLVVNDCESEAGQVLLIGGYFENAEPAMWSSEVFRVDLASGMCTAQPPLGRIVQVDGMLREPTVSALAT